MQKFSYSFNSSKKMNVSYIFHILVIFIFFCVLDTTNMVKTCDYLYPNKKVYFADPGAGRKLGNKNRVKQS